MKKSIFILLIVLAVAAPAFTQDQKASAPSQFTKTELLAFSDLKALLSAINTGQDYSMYLVRNFNLTLTASNTEKTTTQLSETGPGGVWSEKQKAMIEKYAKQGAVFTLENIVMIEGGKKGLINQPSVSFTIKK